MSSSKEVFRGIKVAWDAASFDTTFGGPYRDRKPPDLAVSFPYVVFTVVSNRRSHTTCENEHWETTFRFTVRNRTQELVEDHVDEIGQRVDAFSISVNPGSVVYLRRVNEFYVEETPQSVYSGTLEYEVLREKPRLDI